MYFFLVFVTVGVLYSSFFFSLFLSVFMSSSSSSSSSSDFETEKSQVGMCMKCHEKPIEFETETCHHPCFCKACAMKCASGGKCKSCGQFYAGLTHVKR